MAGHPAKPVKRPPAERADGAIDLTHLERTTFGDRALRAEVLAIFLRQSAVLSAEIAEAGDAAARADAAHKLKGAALGIGAVAVADAAAAFEPAPADAAALSEALARLAARIDDARAAIEDLLSAQ